MQNIDFAEYRKLKFVFFRNNEDGNRTGQKVYEIALVNNDTAVSFLLDGFWAWIGADKKTIDIRRETSNNVYNFCDIFGIY